MLLLFFFSLFFLSASGQNISNKGKEFWLGYGLHSSGIAGSSRKLALYITSDVNSTGYVEIPSLGYRSDFSVAANSIKVIDDIPDQAHLGDEGKFNTGIHIVSQQPVVIYSHIYDNLVSGASLILPVSALGKDYYSINYKQISNTDNAFSYFFVVATEDQTEVEITPSARTKNGWPAGESRIVTLNKGEIYQVLGESQGSEVVGTAGQTSIYNYKGADLTGSRIRSISTGLQACKPIAVFSGSGKVGIGCSPTGVGSSDNLYQQVYPTKAWGKKFFTIPLKSRSYDVIRVFKSEVGATVKVNGSIVAASNFVNDSYCDFPSSGVAVIEADRPIQVVQYAVGMNKSENCGFYPENIGDPEMIYLNPVEQNIDQITVYSSDRYRIQQNYINVTIRKTAVASFNLDGISRASEFLDVPGDPEYSYAQLSVTAGVHTLSAADGFNAIAYGFGTAESYGYSAGANVTGLEITARNKATGEKVSTGCVAEPLQFTLSLVYQASRIKWNFKNGTVPAEIINPVPDSHYTANGKTFYVYELPEEVVFNLGKDYDVEVTVEKSSADGCGAAEVIPFEFSVYSQATVDFEGVDVCEGGETVFIDKSDGMGHQLTSWHWDFGDGQSSSEQSPRHTYLTPGTYSVTLTVTTASGCSPVSTTKPVKVLKKPKAHFNSVGACVSRSIVFEDSSIGGDGNISKWTWKIGDGTTKQVASGAPVVHTFQSPGIYKVKLAVETALGCKDSIEKEVQIYDVPVADFLEPEACVADAFAMFSNTSSIANNGALSYLWNFGDPDSSPGNPNTSTLKDPQHKYASAGIYKVRLIATSSNGCRDTVEKDVTINGATPRAAMEVMNAARLCSGDEVSFINRSEVDFGKITRLEWYFDFANHPAEVLIDEEPVLGKVQKHSYPPFFNSGKKEYLVKLRAFSGTACVSEIVERISTWPITEIDFSLPLVTCLNETAIPLEGYEKFGLDGTGVFKGVGVRATGESKAVFEPARAGAGIHPITFHYTLASGCEVILSKDITVEDGIAVDVGPDREMLAWGEVLLSSSVSGNALSYKWSPAEGLNRDDIPNPVAAPSSDITYTLTIISDKGCVAKDEVRLSVLNSPRIPNAFTPNSDAVNDVWGIKNLESLPKCTVEVFNRYGTKVYQSTGYSIPWDGRYKGEDLPAGTYYYVINPGNQRKSFTGYVSIVR